MSQVVNKIIHFEITLLDVNILFLSQKNTNLFQNIE